MARRLQMLASMAVLAVAAAACGSAPTQSSGGGGGSQQNAQQSSFKACMVTDTGGIDDRSFNESSWNGVKQAEKKLGIKGQYLQSKAESDYVPNINAFVQQGCGLVLTVGFLMDDATKTAAKAHPKQKFAIVDDQLSPPLKNVRGLIFDTAQAGFLGGYLAAGMTKSGKVATFGGQKLPTVTIYMDGYYDGVQYYNTKHHKNVQVLGWNEKTQNGTFTGNFTDQAKGRQVTQTFLQQGADIVFPVAGNVGLGAAKAVQQSGGKANMLWVDTDGCTSAPQYCKYFIYSVVKKIPVEVQKTIKQAKSGSFSGGNYVGTLDNGGTGLAPYHKWKSKVPDTLKSEIKQVKQGIIAGKIKVASPSQPKS
jgi:basic membrane protein A